MSVGGVECVMCIPARWAFTAATWMKERDQFADQIQGSDVYQEGLYYTGSKSHPWSVARRI